MLQEILRVWNRVETVLIGILLVIALVVFLGGTILRYFAAAHAVDWAEEIAIYCIVWATTLSGSALIYEHRHITTEIVVDLLPKPARDVLAYLILLLTLVFCAVMTWYGWEATEFALMLDERSASTLRMPMAYMLFLALPVGMGLMVIRLLLMMLAGARSISSETDHEAAALAEIRAAAEVSK